MRLQSWHTMVLLASTEKNVTPELINRKSAWTRSRVFLFTI